MGLNGDPSKTPHGISRVFMELHESPGGPWISMDLHSIHVCLHRFPQVSMGLHGAPWGSLKVTKYCSVHPPLLTTPLPPPTTHVHAALACLSGSRHPTLSTFEGGIEGFTVAFSTGALGNQEERSVRDRSDPVWGEAEGAVLAAARRYQQVA